MKIKEKSMLMFGSLITAGYPAWRAGKPVRIEAKAHPATLRAFNFFHERLVRLNTQNVLANRIKFGLAIAMLAALTGCIGVVDGGGYSDGDVGVGWWGGWWGGGGGDDRGRDVRGYSARGAASRGAAHGGGGGHASGGGGHSGGGRR